ncbi:hypothetical protein FJV41_40885 [Myxococcus llanfairpwllgwyngyllgogerychwyrndrobwllllantysiliogogogochensis]|uniref:Uncharacterized protein n=1 Tax=Myxococcus llanfairpwllgwyngyllgogerychwyrndrobwllllantysiliogogogochensis TaxID=2590453 RepID=A0A540WMC2_9BACT|nr:hypothetical protein [Myxococcus llanfairpwllgwyngyllgogerychwyrndrobwllllantysiliogogogochensis]TQF10168.1 hypothetical protein FJV41_40885 [Myxococcus llanfairpwllgwyngyllgogerychwyrndrobwllllantysiliogogogochensis]
MGNIVQWFIRGVCAAAGALAIYLPMSPMQRGADTAAQVCESVGVQAYPRDSNGEVVPRPDEAATRSVGLMRQGSGWVPVTLPAKAASSTVEDVGPSDARGAQ